MQQALIIQRIVPHYRVPFFKELQRQLETSGINLSLIYSVESGSSDPFSDKTIYPWAKSVRNFSFHIANRRLSLQPINPLTLSDYNIVIFEQANENLFNLIIFLFRFIFNYKTAYWGHGRNRQSNKKFSFSEIFKKYSLGWSDWWFAYTGETTRYLIKNGISPSQISTVNNSIDTSDFISNLSKVDENLILKTKNELKIQSNNIALFCGSMYAKRGMDFLLAAADQIRGEVDDFHLLVAGSGAGASIVEDACKTRDWIHYLGPVYEAEKALAFSMSKIILMPGIVGLIVIDSLVSGVPLITTESDQHGPEIEYIEHGKNGFITEPSLPDFVTQAIELLTNDEQLQRLKSNCIKSSLAFSTQAMAKNFVAGISLCLSQK